jgi:hypothetical protein
LYLWFSICVIPINSAINPILYTLSTPLFWEKVKETIKKMLFCISKGLCVVFVTAVFFLNIFAV